MDRHNFVMLPRDAPTDVLNEMQLVQEFYGADTPADHQRVMALFAPNAQLDLPQLFVSGRDSISAVMFYAKSFIADIDIEPYMVEVSVGAALGHNHHTATSSLTAPTSSTTSTDSTSSTCTSAATSRRRGSGRPPKARSSGSAGAPAGPSTQKQQPSRKGKKQHSSQYASDVQPRTRSRQHSDQTEQLHMGQNGTRHHQPLPAAMSKTHVYAVATITPKSVARMVTFNLLPREIHLRTRITLVWDDEAGEVLQLQERPDNLPVGLIPQILKRTVGSALGIASTRSQWLLGKLSGVQLVANWWPGVLRLYGTGL